MVGRVHWLFGHSSKFLLQLGKWTQDTLATWVHSQLLHNSCHTTESGKLLLLLCLVFGIFNFVFTGLIETGKWWNGIKNKNEFGQSKCQVHIASIFCKNGVCYPVDMSCLAVTSVLFRQLLCWQVSLRVSASSLVQPPFSMNWSIFCSRELLSKPTTSNNWDSLWVIRTLWPIANLQEGWPTFSTPIFTQQLYGSREYPSLLQCLGSDALIAVFTVLPGAFPNR